MNFDIKNKIKNILQSLRHKAKYIFCHHDWELKRSDKFKIICKDGSEEGEVVISFLECLKCKTNKIIVHDRTHYKKRLK